MAAKWALDPRSAMDVDDEQPRASTRLSAGKPRRLKARSEASADDACDRAAREAAVAAPGATHRVDACARAGAARGAGVDARVR